MLLQGRWVRIKPLPGGGLGAVWVCRQQADGMLFVVKLPKNANPANQTMLDDEERRLVRHQGPGVVRYFGSVQVDDGRRGYAMELMHGDLLGRGRLSPLGLIDLIGPVVGALDVLHRSAMGAHHGDLKRKNILVSGTTAKLADFGLARGGLGQTMMIGGHQGGTPGYMPPEGCTSPAGDAYSLGAVFWASLVGREPTVGEHLSISIPGHPLFQQWVNAMLAPTPGNRPTMAAILEVLPALRLEAQREARRRRIDAVAEVGGALAAFIAVVGGVFLLAKAAKA